jgi:cation diffusion facilitator CzcD-associated flavoprotein CzcO
LAVANKKNLAIGSGATAVTIVPELAADAEQDYKRSSPTYIAASPNHDKMVAKLKRLFPRKIAYRLLGTKNILYVHCLFTILQVLSREDEKFHHQRGKKRIKRLSC